MATKAASLDALQRQYADVRGGLDHLGGMLTGLPLAAGAALGPPPPAPATADSALEDVLLQVLAKKREGCRTSLSLFGRLLLSLSLPLSHSLTLSKMYTTCRLSLLLPDVLLMHTSSVGVTRLTALSTPLPRVQIEQRLTSAHKLIHTLPKAVALLKSLLDNRNLAFDAE